MAMNHRVSQVQSNGSHNWHGKSREKKFLPPAVKSEIRRKYQPYKVSWRQLAEEYGVSQDRIARILKETPRGHE